MTNYDDLEDPLLNTIESILRDDIPDPNRRRAVAMIIRANVRSTMTHSLRQKFDPYLGIGAVKPTVEEALTAMRGAVIRLAGFDRDDPDRWNVDKVLHRGRDKERNWGDGPSTGNDRNDQGDH